MMNKFYKIFCLLIISQMFFYFDSPIRIDRILLVLTLLSFFASKLKRKRDTSIGKTDMLMIIFAILISWSLLTNDYTEITSKTLTNVVFNICIIPFLIYFMLKNIEYEKEQVKKFLIYLCLIGFYLSITSIAERYDINFLIWPKYINDATLGIHYGRSRGPFLHSVFLGINLVIAFCATLIILFDSNAKIIKMLMLFAVVLNMLGLYFTVTRSPWIAFALSCGLYFIYEKRIRKSMILIFIVLTIVYLSGLASKFSISQETLFAKRQNTVTDRYVNYKIAFMMGIENPIFGVGIGKMGDNFEKYYSKIGSPEFGGWDGNHNEFLGIFAELGLLAITIYIWIFYRLIKNLIVSLKAISEKNVFERLVIVSSLSILSSYIIIATFSDIHSSLMHNVLVFAFCGISESIEKKIG